MPQPPQELASLPYRSNVGIALFNRAGLVFAGRAIGSGPEIVNRDHAWQMPQGGIAPDEELVAAARRELFEETNVTSVQPLAVTPDWWTYDFPAYHGQPHRLSAFRGQRQRWVALRFAGDDREIDVLHPPDGHKAEFTAWDWFPLWELPRLVMPYKAAVYRQVADAFDQYAARSRYPVRVRSIDRD